MLTIKLGRPRHLRQAGSRMIHRECESTIIIVATFMKLDGLGRRTRSIAHTAGQVPSWFEIEGYFSRAKYLNDAEYSVIFLILKVEKAVVV